MVPLTPVFTESFGTQRHRGVPRWNETTNYKSRMALSCWNSLSTSRPPHPVTWPSPASFLCQDTSHQLMEISPTSSILALSWSFQVRIEATVNILLHSKPVGKWPILPVNWNRNCYLTWILKTGAITSPYVVTIRILIHRVSPFPTALFDITSAHCIVCMDSKAMFNQVDSPPHLDLWFWAGSEYQAIITGGGGLNPGGRTREKIKTGNATIENATTEPTRPMAPTCDPLFIAFLNMILFNVTGPIWSVDNNNNNSVTQWRYQPNRVYVGPVRTGHSPQPMSNKYCID